jgi:hypothetical protein
VSAADMGAAAKPCPPLIHLTQETPLSPPPSKRPGERGISICFRCHCPFRTMFPSGGDAAPWAINRPRLADGPAGASRPGGQAFTSRTPAPASPAAARRGRALSTHTRIADDQACVRPACRVRATRMHPSFVTHGLSTVRHCRWPRWPQGTRSMRHARSWEASISLTRATCLVPGRFCSRKWDC